MLILKIHQCLVPTKEACTVNDLNTALPPLSKALMMRDLTTSLIMLSNGRYD